MKNPAENQQGPWSWRESNPRPNEEIISFLHAYLCLNFRAAAEPKPSTATLSSKNFIYAARPTWTISDVAAPLDQNASEQQLPSDVPSQHLVPGLSVDLLCFNHAARAYCLSPDKFSRTEIKVPANEALHAYLPFLPAVKSSQPHDNHSQRNDITIRAAKIGIFSEYAILFLQKIIRKNGYAAIKTKISASFCLPLPSKHTSL